MEQLRTRQQGVVLFIALIVLVALTLAGIALVRSVDTSNVIAGNLAFKAGSLQAADIGIEQAASVLPTIVTTTLETNQTPASSSTNPNYWYYATRRQDDANGLPTTKEYGAAGTATTIDWSSVPPVSSTAVAGNTVQVVIDRLCQGPPPVTDIQGKCFADDPGVHANHAFDHGQSDAARAVHRHHRGETRPAKAAHGVGQKRRVLPHARPHGGLGQLEYDGRHAANEQGNGVLEDPPRRRVGRHQCRFSGRAGEIDSPATRRLQQGLGGRLETELHAAWQPYDRDHGSSIRTAGCGSSRPRRR